MRSIPFYSRSICLLVCGVLAYPAFGQTLGSREAAKAQAAAINAKLLRGGGSTLREGEADMGLVDLKAYDLQVGQLGRFIALGTDLFWEVERILGDKEMIIHLSEYVPGDIRRHYHCRFVFTGLVTTNLSDGKHIPLEDVYKVSGTKKLGRQTLPLLELESAESSQKRIAAHKEKVARQLAEEKAQAEKQAAQEKADRKAKAEKWAKDEAKRKQQSAAAKLKLIRQLLADGKKDAAKARLEQLINDYPGTKAAEEAKELLDR
jgi:hypothetical protein